MKGLVKIPDTQDLVAAYNQLQSTEKILPVDQLALYSQWARLDPRLGEILVSHLIKFVSQLAIGSLRESLAKQPWPRSMLVLLRFAELGVSDDDKRLFRHFFHFLNTSFEEDAPQLFFIPLQKSNAVIMKEEVEKRSLPYVDSGFIGSQSLLPKSRWPKSRTVLKIQERLAILEELFRSRTTVTVADYVQACKGMIATRQAQRDLAERGQGSGRTRRRKYRRASGSN